MEENRMPTSEMATSSSPKGAKIDVSEELLRLLRAINEKLDSGAKLVREKSAAPDEVSAKEQEIPAKGRWRDNTLPSLDFASELSNS
jgi:hypothetical protein